MTVTPRSFDQGTTCINIVLHKYLEIATIVNRLNSRLESYPYSPFLVCPSEITRRFGRTFLMGRDQGRTIAEDNTLEQKRITRQMILRAQVDFISTFFEGLLSPVNFTLESKR